MVGLLKKNWILIVIIGLSFFLLFNISPQLLAILGSLLLIDFSADYRSKTQGEYTTNGFGWKYVGYSVLTTTLIFAALLLFKHYT